MAKAFSFAFKHRIVLFKQLDAILEPNLSLVKYGGLNTSSAISLVTSEIIPKLIDLAKSSQNILLRLRVALTRLFRILLH